MFFFKQKVFVYLKRSNADYLSNVLVWLKKNIWMISSHKRKGKLYIVPMKKDASLMLLWLIAPIVWIN